MAQPADRRPQAGGTRSPRTTRTATSQLSSDPNWTCNNRLRCCFGFLDEDRLVGYGGIVHLCWPDRRGEVSFLTSSDRASGDAFRRDWEAYLAMLVPICRDGLGLHKLTTETYGFRTEVISFLENAGFAEEGVLVDHHRVGDRWVNSHAHGLLLD